MARASLLSLPVELQPPHRPMTAEPRVRRLFARRLLAVSREMPGVRAGDAEAIHRMRVASRRLREAVPVVGSDGGPGGRGAKSGRKAVRALRRVTRALGGVRELDVALALLNGVGVSQPTHRGAIDTVSEVIRWEREVRRGEMVQRLDRVDVKDIRRRIAARIADFEATPTGNAWRTRLGERIARRADGVEAAVDVAGDLYAPVRLHGVRIAAKKLRYALELARELARVPTLGALRRLKTLQDLLGRLHDMEVLAAYTRLFERQIGTRGRRRARIGALLDAIEKEIRLVHVTYMTSRPALAAIVARCRTEFCPSLVSTDAADRAGA